jgi:hypothetical protein
MPSISVETVKAFTFPSPGIQSRSWTSGWGMRWGIQGPLHRGDLGFEQLDLGGIAPGLELVERIGQVSDTQEVELPH